MPVQEPNVFSKTTSISSGHSRTKGSPVIDIVDIVSDSEEERIDLTIGRAPPGPPNPNPKRARQKRALPSSKSRPSKRKKTPVLAFIDDEAEADDKSDESNDELFESDEDEFIDFIDDSAIEVAPAKRKKCERALERKETTVSPRPQKPTRIAERTVARPLAPKWAAFRSTSDTDKYH